MEMCLRVLKESNKSRFDSYSRQQQCIDHIPYYLSGLLRAHFFQQPFSYSVICILIKVSLLRPALFYRKTVTTTNSVKLWRWFLDQQSGGTYLDNSNGKKSESRQDFEMFVYGMEYILIGLIYTLRYVEPLYRGKVSSHHRATTAVKFRCGTRLKMRIFYLFYLFTFTSDLPYFSVNLIQGWDLCCLKMGNKWINIREGITWKCFIKCDEDCSSLEIEHFILYI